MKNSSCLGHLPFLGVQVMAKEKDPTAALEAFLKISAERNGTFVKGEKMNHPIQPNKTSTGPSGSSNKHIYYRVHQ